MIKRKKMVGPFGANSSQQSIDSKSSTGPLQGMSSPPVSFGMGREGRDKKKQRERMIAVLFRRKRNYYWIICFLGCLFMVVVKFITIMAYYGNLAFINQQSSLNLISNELDDDYNNSNNYTYYNMTKPIYRDPHFLERLDNWKHNEFALTTKNKTTNETKPGAWIHVGKSGGSTLLELTNKYSFLSKLTTYCHIGMCDDLKGFPRPLQQDNTFEKVLFVIWNIRDPFDRTGSAFEYMHPYNNLAPQYMIQNNYQFSMSCFLDSYEQFTYYLDNSTKKTTNEETKTTKTKTKTKATTTATTNTNNNNNNTAVDCWQQAQDLMNHGITAKKIGGHLYYDTGYWVDKMKQQQQFINYNSSTSSESYLPYMLVIRNENLLDDYKMINWLLGQEQQQNDTLHNKPNNKKKNKIIKRHKDYSHRYINVTRYNLTDIGRKRLCIALKREYQDYFWVLKHAANINQNDIQHAIEIAKQNCPNINILPLLS